MFKRGSFSVPVDTPDHILEKSKALYGRKFIEAMDRQGWVLRSELSFQPHLIADRHEPERKHWGMIGDFSPQISETETIYHDVPDRVIEQLRKKHGRKLRVL